MKDIFAQLTQFTSDANNVAEFLILDLDGSVVGDEAREKALSEWATAHGHSLRAPGERNPIESLVEGEVEGWLYDRHFKDLVHKIKGPDQQLSTALATELVASIGPADYPWSNYTIDDWTFCEVVVGTQPHRCIVVAFLGED